MPTTFAPTTLAEMDRRLQDRRQSSTHLAAALQQNAVDALDDIDVSDLLDRDNPDPGSNHAERVRALRLAQLASATATAADHALHRLAAGTYGLCDSCGCRIPLARLRAVPETPLCVSCKVREEDPLAPPAMRR
jgi:DnaK suppressor protein